MTPYELGERYAGGDYMFASRAAGGLPLWTKHDRPIRGKDIVAWVNLGMHHIPPGGGHAGNADGLALVQAASERLLRPQPGGQPGEQGGTGLGGGVAVTPGLQLLSVHESHKRHHANSIGSD